MSDVNAVVTLYWDAINSSLQSHPDIPVPPPSHCEGLRLCPNSAKNFILIPDSPAKMCII